MLITIVLQYQGHLLQLESEIDALAKEIEEYKIIQSIPGNGDKDRGNNHFRNWRNRSV